MISLHEVERYRNRDGRDGDSADFTADRYVDGDARMKTQRDIGNADRKARNEIAKAWHACDTDSFEVDGAQETGAGYT